MKKFFASISFLCYFAVTSGIVINSHYCMNRLASAELFAKPAKNCGICGMDTHGSKGCCKDEIKIVKLDQDQKTTPLFSYQIPSIEALVSTPSSFIVAAFYNIDEQRHFHNHSPPLLSAQDTYLQNNVFRI